jgi:hypothetical protein
LILLLYFGLSPAEVAEYSPHGFKHVLVGAGQQLKSIGCYSEGDIERLGSWAKGSTMPLRYDNEAGVSELAARHKVQSALRTGWRPSAEGELPKPLPSSSSCNIPSVIAPISDKLRVGHSRSKIIHYAVHGCNSTSCGKWQCGTGAVPSKYAVFTEIPSGWAWCSFC